MSTRSPYPTSLCDIWSSSLGVSERSSAGLVLPSVTPLDNDPGISLSTNKVSEELAP